MQFLPFATRWSAMVLPKVAGAAGNDRNPSMLFSPGWPWTSFVVSTTTVGASVPTPAIGQIAEVDGLSVDGVPEARFVVQDGLCQLGSLSLSTPKLEPPTTSR